MITYLRKNKTRHGQGMYGKAGPGICVVGALGRAYQRTQKRIRKGKKTIQGEGDGGEEPEGAESDI